MSILTASVVPAGSGKDVSSEYGISNKGRQIPSSFAAVSIFLILLYFVDAYLYVQPSIYKKKQQLLSTGNKQAQVLIMGSSHALFDIRPDKLDEPALNFANVSQSLKLDEKLLQKILQHSQALQLVIIPISYFSLEENLTDTVDEWRDCLYFKYFGVSEREAMQVCLDPRYFSLSLLYGSRLAPILFQQTPPLVPCQIDNFGWGENTESLTATQANKAGQARVEFLQSFMKPESFELHQKIVKQMIDACIQRHIKVLLVTTPVWTTFRKFTNKNRIERIQQLMRSLVVPGLVKYGDYWNDERFVLADFGDTDHLNSDGAAKFSRFLDREFIKPLLASKQSLVNKIPPGKAGL